MQGSRMPALVAAIAWNRQCRSRRPGLKRELRPATACAAPGEAKRLERRSRPDAEWSLPSPPRLTAHRFGPEMLVTRRHRGRSGSRRHRLLKHRPPKERLSRKGRIGAERERAHDVLTATHAT